GNVFNFIMQYEKLDFPEVLRLLAQKTGVKLPQRSMFTRQEEKKTQDLFELNEMAAGFYQTSLKTPAGRATLEYLKKRGFAAKTILAFRLGFAPANNGLLNFMRAKKVPAGLLEKAGLVSHKEEASYYDRFRQKLIFPIMDARARVLGFGARVLDNSLPKYINSPETPIYNKGSHLYGLHLAKDEIKLKDFCIIVEGYVDLLSCHQNNIGNIVASLGTALTTQQIRLLKRYTHNAVVIFDADRAGELASLRSLDLLIEEEVNVKMVSLPQGEDPDSFLHKFGGLSFQQKIDQASELFDYKLNLLCRNFDLDTVEGKVNIASQMLPTIKRVQNRIRRGAYVKRLAQEFSRGERSLGEDWILAELKKVKENLGYFNQEAALPAKALASRAAEEMVLKILLDDKQAVDEVKASLDLEDFQDLRIREALRVIYRLSVQGEELIAAKLISCLENREAAQLIAQLCSAEQHLLDQQKCLADCIKRIKSDSLKNRLNKLQREIKLAQSWGHKDKIIELVGQYNELIKNQMGQRCRTQNKVAAKAGQNS
ncbi:MAG: DNA primase, partial [Candidatus Omnitrophica bacterium]|nr:DNA primase [Candidatus Omnitrophota bacterium]